MVRKEDISAVRIVWPENKPGHLEAKKCVRGVTDPRECEICHYFAGKRTADGKYHDFWQRWTGDNKRLIAYISCGAPLAEKKAVAGDPQAGVVGISAKHQDFEKERDKQAEEKRLETEKNKKPPVVPDKTPEPPAEKPQSTEPQLAGAGSKMETAPKVEEPVL